MGDFTPKDLFTRWDSSEITEEEAIGHSIQGLVQLEDRLDAHDLKMENRIEAHDLKLENLIEAQRKEIFDLKKRLEQQETVSKAQIDTLRAQDRLLKVQAETIRKQKEAHESQIKEMDNSLRILIDHKFRLINNKIQSLDLLVSQMIKPNEMVEMALLELGKMANASQAISKLARQLLDMRKDDFS